MISLCIKVSTVNNRLWLTKWLISKIIRLWRKKKKVIRNLLVTNQLSRRKSPVQVRPRNRLIWAKAYLNIWRKTIFRCKTHVPALRLLVKLIWATKWTRYDNEISKCRWSSWEMGTNQAYCSLILVSIVAHLATTLMKKAKKILRRQRQRNITPRKSIFNRLVYRS